jgi:GTP-binding protein
MPRPVSEEVTATRGKAAGRRDTAFSVAAAVSYQIILTKADKLKAAEVEAVAARTLAAIAKRPAAFPRVLATSSEKGAGIPELRAEIAHACMIGP